MRRLMRTSLIVGAILVVVSCELTPAATPTIRQTQQVGDITIVLEMAAAPRLNQPQQVEIALTDSRGVPLSDANVSLDLVMIEHPMGINTPIADPIGAGRYRAEAVFTMVGAWETAVVAVVQGREYRARFLITVPQG